MQLATKIILVVMSDVLKIHYETSKQPPPRIVKKHCQYGTGVFDVNLLNHSPSKWELVTPFCLLQQSVMLSTRVSKGSKDSHLPRHKRTVLFIRSFISYNVVAPTYAIKHRQEHDSLHLLSKLIDWTHFVLPSKVDWHIQQGMVDETCDKIFTRCESKQRSENRNICLDYF